MFFLRNCILSVIIIIRDITTELEVSMLRSDFAYASHQLRTPITEALWSLETILEERDIDKVNKYTKSAYSSLNSVKKLSEELISTSEIDQGVIIPDFIDVKLLDIVNQAIDKISSTADKNNIRVKLSPVPKLFTVKTDPGLLKEILIEVLDNSVLYGYKNSQITIDIKFNDDSTLIGISNDGTGIIPEHQALVFTKFFRGNNFPTSEIPGAGLGLYIAKGYTKLIGGKIWFKSEDNKITTFYLLIPKK